MSESLNKSRVLGVLAGRDLSADVIFAWAKSADFVVAADGAANQLNDVEIIPNIVIGDMDSIAEGTLINQSTVMCITDQNTTDCDKMFDFLCASGYPSVTVCGLEGDAIDHMIGSLLSAARSTLEIRFVTRTGMAWIIRKGNSQRFCVPVGSRLSLLPLVECSDVELLGTEWEILHKSLNPLGFVSLSNRVVDEVIVSIGTGTAVLFISHPS